MAWNARWTIDFDDRNGNALRVTIHDENYSGAVSALTGSDNPFVTEENDDDSLFEPVRGQTGHIEIKTDDSNLLANIMPANSLSRYVTLTNTTTNALLWQGYMQPQMFSQEWSGANRVLSFPIASVLANLENVNLPESHLYDKTRIYQLIAYIFETFGLSFNFYFFCEMLYTADFLRHRILAEVFYKEETNFDEDTVEIDRNVKQYGMTGLDIISEICKIYNLVVREDADNIIFSENAHYIVDYVYFDGVVNLKNCTKYSFLYDPTHPGERIGAIMPVPSDLPGQNTLLPLLDNVNWRGNSNNVSLIAAYYNVIVKVMMQDWKTDKISLPIFNYSEVMTNNCTLYDGSILMTRPRSSDNAKLICQYAIYNSRVPSSNAWIIGSSTYSECESYMPWHGYLGYRHVPPNYYAGAFPVRWGLDAHLVTSGNKNNITSRDSLLLATVPTPLRFVYSANHTKVAEIKGYVGVHPDDSYLSIKFTPYAIKHNQWYYDFKRETGTPSWTQEGRNNFWRMSNSFTLRLYFCIEHDSKYYDGTSWVSSSSPIYIPISWTNGQFDGNYNQAWQGIQNNGGYYIPLIDSVTGDIKIGISCIITSSAIYAVDDGKDDGDYWHDIRQVIVDELDIQIIRNTGPMTLNEIQKENNYYKKTGASGYKGEVKQEMTIGTNNGNEISPSFLYDDINAELTDVEYIDIDKMKYKQRPEQHLAMKMAEYYSKPRYIYEAIIERKDNRLAGLQWLNYTYNNKRFMPIDKTHNWREDTQTVKLIEITDIEEVSQS